MCVCVCVKPMLTEEYNCACRGVCVRDAYAY